MQDEYHEPIFHQSLVGLEKQKETTSPLDLFELIDEGIQFEEIGVMVWGYSLRKSVSPSQRSSRSLEMSRTPGEEVQPIDRACARTRCCYLPSQLLDKCASQPCLLLHVEFPLGATHLPRIWHCLPFAAKDKCKRAVGTAMDARVSKQTDQLQSAVLDARIEIFNKQ